jgi:hypothetical protein
MTATGVGRATIGHCTARAGVIVMVAVVVITPVVAVKPNIAGTAIIVSIIVSIVSIVSRITWPIIADVGRASRK